MFVLGRQNLLQLEAQLSLVHVHINHSVIVVRVPAVHRRRNGQIRQPVSVEVLRQQGIAKVLALLLTREGVQDFNLRLVERVRVDDVKDVHLARLQLHLRCTGHVQQLGVVLEEARTDGVPKVRVIIQLAKVRIGHIGDVADDLPLGTTIRRRRPRLPAPVSFSIAPAEAAHVFVDLAPVPDDRAAPIEHTWRPDQNLLAVVGHVHGQALLAVHVVVVLHVVLRVAVQLFVWGEKMRTFR